jgi:hypothetical protein
MPLHLANFLERRRMPESLQHLSTKCNGNEPGSASETPTHHPRFACATSASLDGMALRLRHPRLPALLGPWEVEDRHEEERVPVVVMTRSAQCVSSSAIPMSHHPHTTAPWHAIGSNARVAATPRATAAGGADQKTSRRSFPRPAKELVPGEYRGRGINHRPRQNNE